MACAGCWHDHAVRRRAEAVFCELQTEIAKACLEMADKCGERRSIRLQSRAKTRSAQFPFTPLGKIAHANCSALLGGDIPLKGAYCGCAPASLVNLGAPAFRRLRVALA